MHTAASQPYPVVSQVNVPAGLGGWGEYPPPVDGQTPVKTLPSHHFFGGQ